MSSRRFRRVASVVSTALLALMMIGPAPALGAQANWHFYNPTTGAKDAGELLPSVVAPGSAAGYSFRIKNDGPSNISQLFLTDSRYADDPTNAVPAYFFNDRGTDCQLDPYLYCAFGALNAFDSITVTIAYNTLKDGPATFPVTFQLNSTGNTFSDNKNNPRGNSHGDTLSLTLTTTLNAGKDFDGGFNTDGFVVENVKDLGKKNIQSGAITPPSGSIYTPVTVEDGLPNTAFNCPTTIDQCATAFGEWTRLNVNKGATFTDGFKVVLTIWGPAVPNGATVDTIKLIHVLDDGPTYVIGDVPSERCTGDGLNVDGDDADSLGDECITVTKNGNTFQIVAWLLSNGGTRFGY